MTVDGTRVPAHITEGLTDDQHEALRIIVRRMQAGETHTKLDGKAGVGKTYLTGRIVRCLSKVLNGQVIVTAPTHEAVAQVKSSLDQADIDVEAKTLHSTLDLRMSWNKDERVLVKNNKWSPATPRFLVVDEASMIGEVLSSYTDKMIDKAARDVSVLWVGDTGQLPPVQEKPSGVLYHDGPTLDTIVRQSEGSAIVTAANIVREGKEGWVTKALSVGEAGAGGDVRVTKAATDEIVSEFENDDGLYGCRVLAFRNRSVRDWNRVISSRLFPGTETWQPGMRAIAGETWIGPEEDDGTVYTSMAYRVEECTLRNRPVAGSKTFTAANLPVWDLSLRDVRTGELQDVRALDPSGQKAFNREKNKRLSACKSRDAPWYTYYRLMEALADIRYGYASTVHKAQGATIDRVYCDYRDIITAPGGEAQSKPLTYVAVTRASQVFTFCV